MENVIIRRATPEDAAAIANVHINTWREAYKNLMPAEFLEERPLGFNKRHRFWKRLIEEAGQDIFVADCSENGVVGVINGHLARDEEYKDHAEIYCFYLFKKYHGKKIGFRLLQEYLKSIKADGFQQMYLWVLKGNPTIEFYEKVGGKFNGRIKDEEIAGKAMSELCYVWNNLDLEKK